MRGHSGLATSLAAGNGEANWAYVKLNAPIPEPGTLTLLVTGLIGLLCYAWRKRK